MLAPAGRARGESECGRGKVQLALSVCWSRGREGGWLEGVPPWGTGVEAVSIGTLRGLGASYKAVREALLVTREMKVDNKSHFLCLCFRTYTITGNLLIILSSLGRTWGCNIHVQGPLFRSKEPGLWLSSTCHFITSTVKGYDTAFRT